MTLQRISRDRKKPQTYVAEPASVADGRGKSRARGRGRGRGRGKGRGQVQSDDKEATDVGPAAADFQALNMQVLIGRRLALRWEQEEEDFEGYVRDYKPGKDFPHEVAYDDGDEEWGYFTATHFHTDEAQRAYSWLRDQDEAVERAVGAISKQQQPLDSKPAVQLENPVPRADVPAVSSATDLSYKTNPTSLAAQKSLLRANGSKAAAGIASADKQVVSADTLPNANGIAVSASAEQQAAMKAKGSKPDAKAAAVLQKSIAEAKTKAAKSPAHEQEAIASNKRRKVSPAADINTPSKKRPSSSSMLADSNHLVQSKAIIAAVGGAAAPATEPGLQVNKQAQQPAEPKRRRLHKSNGAVASQQPEQGPVKQEDAQVNLSHIKSEDFTSRSASTDRQMPTPASGHPVPSVPDAVPSGNSSDAALVSSAMLQLAPVHSSAEIVLMPKVAQEQSVVPAAINPEEALESAQPDSKPCLPDNAALVERATQLDRTVLSGMMSTKPDSSPSLQAAELPAKSASHLQHVGATQPASSPRPPALVAQSSSAAQPKLPYHSIKLPLSATASSTRIAMPRGLTSLSSLRTAESIPQAEAASSPAVVPDVAVGTSSATELAKSEGELQATMQQFEELLQTTLQRTKEGVRKVREFVLKAAGQANGKVAARRLIIMLLDHIETAQMHKRIDLFYLMDAILQVSQRENKAGCETQTEALKIVAKVIAAGLHRIAQAMGQDSECISKASKVFEIWQRRQILKASVVAPALQLMAKLRAEHELARAAAEPVVRMGQAVEGRRPMRVNLPCVPPGSQTGLPEYIMHVTLDQWSGLAGFRFQRADGQQVEFQLKPQWTLTQQASIDDWDVNPASAQLSQAEVLADASILREQHLDDLEMQREAKENRECSPWGHENPMPEASPESDFPLSPVQQEDIDMDEAQSPDQGHSGYLSTDPNSTWNFEPPRAPVHQGVSGESPPYGSYGSASAQPQQWSWGGLTHGGSLSHVSSMSSLGHMALQHSQSIYDPLTSQMSLQQPYMQSRTAEHMLSMSDRQRPDSAEHWYNVPFEEGSQHLPVQGQPTTGGPAQSRSVSGQAAHPSVAVRDSNTDFDADTGWSDDDAPPPLPAEPAPPLPEAPPPLPAEPSPGGLPPLPPDEDQPPLPPSETMEARLATAGMFEPAIPNATKPSQPSLPPLPSPSIGFNYGY